jgi:hypothetical protein
MQLRFDYMHEYDLSKEIKTEKKMIKDISYDLIYLISTIG